MVMRNVSSVQQMSLTLTFSPVVMCALVASVLMGSSASSRAKAQAKASATTAATSSNASSTAVSDDVTSGAVKNAGGDITVVDVATGADSAASDERQSADPDSQQAKRAEVKWQDHLENVDKSSTESGSSVENTGDLATKIGAEPQMCDIACQSNCVGDQPDEPVTDLDAPPPSPRHAQSASSHRNPDVANIQNLPSSVSAVEVPRPSGEDNAALTSGEIQLPAAERISERKDKVVVDILQQQKRLPAIGDHHKTAVVFAAQRFEVDPAPGASPMNQVISEDKLEQKQQPSTASASFLPRGDDQHPVEGALPVGPEGPASVSDHKAAAKPESQPPLQQQQQRRPTEVEGPLPGGKDGNLTVAAAAVANAEQHPTPVCDVEVCESGRLKVVSVAHDENADNSMKLPPVSN